MRLLIGVVEAIVVARRAQLHLAGHNRGRVRCQRERRAAAQRATEAPSELGRKAVKMSQRSLIFDARNWKFGQMHIFRLISKLLTFSGVSARRRCTVLW